MKWIEVKVVYDHSDSDLAAELIADAFYDIDLRGVVIEDPDLEPSDGWAEDAVTRPGSHAVVGYFSKGFRAEKKAKLLAERIDELKERIGFTCHIN